MKLTLGTLTSAPRVHRRSGKCASKRPNTNQTRVHSSTRDSVDVCDNSNDSGLGFDHHLDYNVTHRNGVNLGVDHKDWSPDQNDAKRKRLEIKLESDNAHDDFSFPEVITYRGKREVPDRGHIIRSDSAPISYNDLPQREHGSVSRGDDRIHSRPVAIATRRSGVPITLNSHISNSSRNGKVQLQILCQPEQQHRARYQTEGSRGAVKDRSGNGFPIVKLVGYDKPAVLQVFIGTDVGRVAPHMFYQACRVSGKNSTPCVEKKIEGTIVIEVNFDPSKDMVVTCDCVGILKERNVDVEHRFPDQPASRNKKKSTRCRMVFRTTITNPDGSTETLQTASQSILCTQPPGIPEICKKSLTSCPCTGGMELFILGKNFLKDTRVIFQDDETDPLWENTVQPDKEFLQQTHLVCVVPAYRSCDIRESVTVRLMVMSSGKMSEPHNFVYTPVNNAVMAPEVLQPCVNVVHPRIIQGMEMIRGFSKSSLAMSGNSPARLRPRASAVPVHCLPIEPMQGERKDDSLMWQPPSLMTEISKTEVKKRREKDSDRSHGMKVMVPPPLLPLPARRFQTSAATVPQPLQLITTPDAMTTIHSKIELSPEDVKGVDLRMKPSVMPLGSVDNLTGTQAPSMATLQQLVTSDSRQPLPTQSADSVEKYLSRLESKPLSNQLITPIKKEVDTANSQMTVMQSALNHQEQKVDYGRDMVPMFSQHSSSSLTSPLPPVPKEYVDISSLSLLQSEQCIPQQPTALVHGGLNASSVLAYGPNSSTNSLVKSLLNQNDPKSIKIEHSVNTSNIIINDNGSVQLPSVLDGVAISRSSSVSVSKNSGLDALVSSAIEGHVMPSLSQSQASVSEKLDKLDALINSAADSHLAPSVSTTNPNFQTSPSEKLIMASNPAPVIPSSSFQLTANEQSAQDQHTNAVLNEVVSDALKQHLLANSSITESKDLPVGNDSSGSKSSTMDDSQQQMEAHIVIHQTSQLEKQMMTPHCPTLPRIAVKNIVMSSDADSNSMQTSPIAIKRMIIEEPALSVVSPANDDNSVVGSVRASPIAVKTMIINSDASDPNSSHIISVSPVTGEATLENSSRSPPIAIKTMIVSPEVATSIANEILSTCTETNKLNDICQSSSDNQMYSSSSVPMTVVTEPTSTAFMSPMIRNDNIASLLPTTQAQQQSSLVITQAPSLPHSENSESCITTSTVPESIRESLQASLSSSCSLYEQQLENMLASSSSPSSHSTRFMEHSTMQNSNMQELLSSADKMENTLLQTKAVNDKFITDSIITMVKEEYKDTSLQANSLVAALQKAESDRNLISSLERHEQSPGISALPVPVVNLSAKNLPSVESGPKKSEEGMVPQELAQMSDHDLLRYINPSCFDQV